MKSMLPVLLKLLLVLAAVPDGTSLSITDGEPLVQYYGALGRSVHIHLTNTDVKHLRIEVHFKGYQVFRYKNKKPRYNKTLENHFKFLDNGTLRLDNLTESLSGNYSIEEFNSGGDSQGTRYINLIIQVPVSPPELSQLCLPHGEIRVSCSSRGDYPEYSWALGGRPLDGGVAILSSETQTVLLRRNISGSITCTVSNRASREHTTQELLTCPGHINYATLLLLLAVCGVAVVILCTILCISNRSREGPNTDGGSPLLVTKVLYTQLRIMDGNKSTPGEE